MIQFLFLAVLGAGDSNNVLELKGTKGIEFMGYCVSKETGEKKEIQGITPAKMTLDLNIEKCSIQKKSGRGTLKVQLFHNSSLISDKTVSEPKVGIELVIPLF
jgi:hypothetical protein